MKRFLYVIAMFFVAGFAWGQFSGGTGTEIDPYQITTPTEFDLIRNYLGDEHSDKYFILNNDIDLADYLSIGNPGYNSGDFWLPIADLDHTFSGKLDGNGKTLRNLKINRSVSYYNPVGLFGCLGNLGKIENLTLVIDELSSVTGICNVGGLVGRTKGGEISHCSVTGDIVGISGKGGYTTGGFVGQHDAGGIISNCFIVGTVDGVMWVGGLVGYNNGIIEYCYSKATVTSTGTDLGGLIGHNSGFTSASITNCYATGSVTGSSTYIGGLLGNNNQGTITNCYSTGAISGGSNMGGLMGKDYFGTVSNSFWDKQTSGLTTSAGTEVGKTTVELKTISTFLEWDFESIWSIYAISSGGISYPYLETNAEVPAPGFEQIFAGGTGEINSPWEIETTKHLNNVRLYTGESYSNKYFKLMNDIDLAPYLTPDADGYNEGALWLPIGNISDQFKGNFNGDNFKVSALQVNRAGTDDVGLFAVLGSGASIRNLGVEVVTSTALIGYDHVGGLAGQNYGTIEKCFVGGSGLISGNQAVGGLVGLNTGTISETYTNPDISALIEAGGLAGKNTGIVSNCFSTGNITRSSGEAEQIGGFCGYGENATIELCYSAGRIIYTGASDPDNKGFLGASSGSNTFSGNYFDLNSSEQSNEVQAVPAAATGKTGSQMKQESTFSGWNFSTIWGILEGQIYPYLTWEYEGMTLDGLIPERSMLYDSGIYTGTIDLDGDNIQNVTVKFTPPAEAGAIDLTFKYATNSNISSVQLLDNPDDLSAYFYFGFADNSILINGLAFELEFPEDPENIWYRQSENDWQVVPSYSPAGLGKAAAPSTSGFSYIIDATQLTYEESGSGEIEFAGDNGGDVPLPIILTSFTATSVNGKMELAWQTVTETNNARFIIYRNSEAIGSVDGAGTTSEPHTYSYTDNTVIPGETYTYVLADVDYANEETKYTDQAVTITIPENDIPTEFALEANYPNPFNPTTAIIYQLSSISDVNLSIFDMSGRKVATLVNESKPAGYHSINWDASNLSSGIYFYRLQAGDFVDTKKMVYMK